MKKIILSILFLLTTFQFVFSEQINRSSSNLEPIELENSQKINDQVLFDKAEPKILLKDKNVSDLDKDSESELSLKNKNAENSVTTEEDPGLEKNMFENSTKLDQKSNFKTDNPESVNKNNTEITSDLDKKENSVQESHKNLLVSEAKNEDQEANKIEPQAHDNNEADSSKIKKEIIEDEIKIEENKFPKDVIDSKVKNLDEQINSKIVESEIKQTEKEIIDSDKIENITQDLETNENTGEIKSLDNELKMIETGNNFVKQNVNEIIIKTDVVNSEDLAQSDEEINDEKSENFNSKSDDFSENENRNNVGSLVQNNEIKIEEKKTESDILNLNEKKLENLKNEIDEETNKNHDEKMNNESLFQNNEAKHEENFLQTNEQELEKKDLEDQNTENLIKKNDEINDKKILENIKILQKEEDKTKDSSETEKEQEDASLKKDSEFISQENEQANEFVLNLPGKKAENQDFLDKDFQSTNTVVESTSTEAMFTENVSEIPLDFESTTIFPEKSDEKIEVSNNHMDSLSKKFSNKIKKLKEHKFKNIQEEINANAENTNSTNDRVCANLQNFKQILSENFEPLYLPILSLLPEDIQLVLLNESVAGIPNASLIFLALNIFILSSFVFLLIRIIEGKKINLNANLNNQLILQTNRIRQLEFDLKTYGSLIEESEQKKSASEALLSEKEAKIKELNDKLSKSIREQEFTEKELSKLKTNETKLIKESNQLKTDLNSLNEVFIQQKSVYSEQIVERDTKILEFTQMIESQKIEIVGLKEKLEDYTATKEQNSKLSTELGECMNTIEILKNSLSIKNSSKNSDIDDYVQVDSQDESNNADSLMNLAQLQMEYKSLQTKYDSLICENEAKDALVESLKNEIQSKQNESGEWETKLKKFEKQIKENEMQIKLLNELRERDTKQHVKALSELDLQLKKKTADADKVSHYMEQLRVKQERIQELEANLTRVEKQSNVERQTFEKQAHENWLNAKKLDKELRETRLELDNLKERMREIESGITQENLAEEPPRPPSTSSNPGGIFPPNGPSFMPFMRQPAFRYPFPPINPAQAAAFMQHLEQQRLGSTSPNQDTSRIPNIPPPPHILQRFLQTQQFMPQQMTTSANSSQQVSPSDLNNSNILASTALNDTSMNNIDNAADNTQNMINDFDFSSNSGFFNHNGAEICNGFHPDQYSNENVNSNFNV